MGALTPPPTPWAPAGTRGGARQARSIHLEAPRGADLHLRLGPETPAQGFLGKGDVPEFLCLLAKDMQLCREQLHREACLEQSAAGTAHPT